jgi:hypothetical protein
MYDKIILAQCSDLYIISLFLEAIILDAADFCLLLENAITKSMFLKYNFKINDFLNFPPNNQNPVLLRISDQKRKDTISGNFFLKSNLLEVFFAINRLRALTKHENAKHNHTGIRILA